MIELSDILRLADADTGYGKKQVLFGVNLAAKAGEITALIGPNGAGKSTVLKFVHGLLSLWSGTAVYEGLPIEGSIPAQQVRRGITFCPQGNRVFGALTVRENLDLGGSHLPDREVAARVATVLEIFPRISLRLKQTAGTLSGGEQQMVAIARALVSKPRLLMLDEPSIGLSPNIVDEVFDKLIEINSKHNVTILLVEQKVRSALAVANHVYSLKLGRVAYDGPPGPLLMDKAKLTSLFL